MYMNEWSNLCIHRRYHDTTPSTHACRSGLIHWNRGLYSRMWVSRFLPIRCMVYVNVWTTRIKLYHRKFEKYFLEGIQTYTTDILFVLPRVRFLFILLEKHGSSSQFLLYIFMVKFQPFSGENHQRIRLPRTLEFVHYHNLCT